MAFSLLFRIVPSTVSTRKAQREARSRAADVGALLLLLSRCEKKRRSVGGDREDHGRAWRCFTSKPDL